MWINYLIESLFHLIKHLEQYVTGWISEKELLITWLHIIIAISVLFVNGFVVIMSTYNLYGYMFNINRVFQ